MTAMLSVLGVLLIVIGSIGMTAILTMLILTALLMSVK